MVNNAIAIIPARGGSKRIPNKNIIDFFGKPLITWTIEAALKTNIFKNVFVDTDSEEIAEVALKYGAQVPFLRDNFNDDFSTVSQSSAYFLSRLNFKEIDFVVQLMANCPLRTSETIKLSYNKFLNSDNTDFQISCFKFGWMNPWWALRLTEDNKGIPIFENTNKRSQDLENLYCPTGAIWMAKSSSLLKYKNFYAGNVAYFEISWEEAIDIDNYDDLKMAKVLFKINEK